jgi:chaperonin GroEL
VVKNFTTIVGGEADIEDIERTIDNLKTELSQTSDLKQCERIQERIARLASGIAIIKVGAATEVEMIEKKHRIEDALEAVKSAQEEGMVPGGGTALLRVAKTVREDIRRLELDNHDQELGASIVLDASKEPVRQMSLNASESPDIIISMIESAENNQGYNFVSREIVDMMSAGVIDPVKVTRTALQNAASVATSLITSGHAVVEL